VDELLNLVDSDAVNFWVVAAPGAGGVAIRLAAAFGFELDEVSVLSLGQPNPHTHHVTGMGGCAGVGVGPCPPPPLPISLLSLPLIGCCSPDSQCKSSTAAHPRVLATAKHQSR
jgi:hypothetical protein